MPGGSTGKVPGSRATISRSSSSSSSLGLPRTAPPGIRSRCSLMNPPNMAAVFLRTISASLNWLSSCMATMIDDSQGRPLSYPILRGRKHVEHLLGRYSDRLPAAPVSLARVFGIHPVGGPLARSPVQLDPHADLVSILGEAVEGLGEKVAFQELELQGDSQPLARHRPEPDKHLPAVDQRPGREHLMAVEARVFVVVGFGDPVVPEFLDAVFEGRVVDLPPGRDLLPTRSATRMSWPPSIWGSFLTSSRERWRRLLRLPKMDLLGPEEERPQYPIRRPVRAPS